MASRQRIKHALYLVRQWASKALPSTDTLNWDAINQHSRQTLIGARHGFTSTQKPDALFQLSKPRLFSSGLNLDHASRTAASKSAQLQSGSWRAHALRRAMLQHACRHVGTVAPKPKQAMLRRLLNTQLGQAFSLQLGAAWQQYSRALFLLVGVLAVYLVWRLTFRVASTFVNLTESVAEWGFMGLAITLVMFTFLYLRAYYTIDPRRAYRHAMIRLNANPAVLEVLGAPLMGSDLRASVLSGGGFKLKNMKIKYQSPRVQMIFPLTGSERKGLVSMEAKKKQGRYRFKLLAVDVRPDEATQALSVKASAGASSREDATRIYVEGDLAAYNRGGVLAELRDPFLRAVSLQQTYDLEDEVEEELEKAGALKPKLEPKTPAEAAATAASAVAHTAGQAAAAAVVGAGKAAADAAGKLVKATGDAISTAAATEEQQLQWLEQHDQQKKQQKAAAAATTPIALTMKAVPGPVTPVAIAETVEPVHITTATPPDSKTTPETGKPQRSFWQRLLKGSSG